MGGAGERGVVLLDVLIGDTAKAAAHYFNLLPQMQHTRDSEHFLHFANRQQHTHLSQNNFHSKIMNVFLVCFKKATVIEFN